MMRPYVPENADVVYVDGARHGEELLTLLKDEKGSVLIVNGAVLPVGVFYGGADYPFHQTGLSLGRCYTFGMLAAKHAMGK